MLFIVLADFFIRLYPLPCSNFTSGPMRVWVTLGWLLVRVGRWHHDMQLIILHIHVSQRCTGYCTLTRIISQLHHLMLSFQYFYGSWLASVYLELYLGIVTCSVGVQKLQISLISLSVSNLHDVQCYNSFLYSLIVTRSCVLEQPTCGYQSITQVTHKPKTMHLFTFLLTCDTE